MPLQERNSAVITLSAHACPHIPSTVRTCPKVSAHMSAHACPHIVRSKETSIKRIDRMCGHFCRNRLESFGRGVRTWGVRGPWLSDLWTLPRPYRGGGVHRHPLHKGGWGSPNPPMCGHLDVQTLV